MSSAQLGTFLTEIGAGSVSSTITLAPGKEPPLKSIHDRIELEILNVNDQTLSLLKDNWEQFTGQWETTDTLLEQLTHEGAVLEGLEEQTTGSAAVLPQLLTTLASHSALVKSHQTTVTTLEYLSTLSSYHAAITALSSSTTAGSLAHSVTLLIQLQSHPTPPAWIHDTPAWALLVKWSKEEESRLVTAITGALEVAYEFPVAREQLLLQLHVVPAPGADGIKTSELFALLSRISPPSFTTQITRIANALHKNLVTPFLTSPHAATSAFEYSPSPTSLTISLTNNAPQQAPPPLDSLQTLLGTLAPHLPPKPFNTSFIPPLQNSLINAFLLPLLPSTTAALPPYLSLLTSTVDFESKFLPSLGYLDFLGGRGEGLVVTEWARGVESHWAKKVGREVLEAVRKEVVGGDWSEVRVEKRVEIEVVVLPPPPEPKPKEEEKPKVVVQKPVEKPREPTPPPPPREPSPPPAPVPAKRGKAALGASRITTPQPARSPSPELAKPAASAPSQVVAPVQPPPPSTTPVKAVPVPAPGAGQAKPVTSPPVKPAAPPHIKPDTGSPLKPVASTPVKAAPPPPAPVPSPPVPPARVMSPPTRVTSPPARVLSPPVRTTSPLVRPPSATGTPRIASPSNSWISPAPSSSGASTVSSLGLSVGDDGENGEEGDGWGLEEEADEWGLDEGVVGEPEADYVETPAPAPAPVPLPVSVATPPKPSAPASVPAPSPNVVPPPPRAVAPPPMATPPPKAAAVLPPPMATPPPPKATPPPPKSSALPPPKATPPMRRASPRPVVPFDAIPVPAPAPVQAPAPAPPAPTSPLSPSLLSVPTLPSPSGRNRSGSVGSVHSVSSAGSADAWGFDEELDAGDENGEANGGANGELHDAVQPALEAEENGDVTVVADEPADAWGLSAEEPAADPFGAPAMETGEGEEEFDEEAGWGWEVEDGVFLSPASGDDDSGVMRLRGGVNEEDSPFARPPPAATRPYDAPPQYRMETCMISQRSMSIMRVADALLVEALAVASPSFPHKSFSSASIPLLKSFVSLFGLYRATAPVFHSRLLLSVPALGMQFANDCEWLGDEVEKVWEKRSGGAGGREGEMKPEVDKAVGMMRSLGEEWREKLIATQRTALMEALDEAKGFLYTEDDSKLAACERSLGMVTHTLEKLGQLWKPVMNSSLYYATLGGLINDVLERVLNEIEDQADISEVESIRLNKLCKVLHGLESLFVEGESSVGREVPIWFKFIFLSELLEASMADILFLFNNGHLVDFSTAEISKLIRALFSDSPARQQNLAHIALGHPDVSASAVSSDEEDEGWGV